MSERSRKKKQARTRTQQAPRNQVVRALLQRSGAGAGAHDKSRKAERAQARQALVREVREEEL